VIVICSISSPLVNWEIRPFYINLLYFPIKYNIPDWGASGYGKEFDSKEEFVRMAERLVEMYAVGTAVEILLNDEWQAGVVIRHDPPAVWVETEDGRAWFVTNRQRIKVASGKFASGK
jgi:hypothetical protein